MTFKRTLVLAAATGAGLLAFAQPASAADSRDFLVWQRTLGVSSASADTHASGDFDSDGDVDGRDFLIWQR